jgi:hypothetical protein
LLLATPGYSWLLQRSLLCSGMSGNGPYACSYRPDTTADQRNYLPTRFRFKPSEQCRHFVRLPRCFYRTRFASAVKISSGSSGYGQGALLLVCFINQKNMHRANLSEKRSFLRDSETPAVQVRLLPRRSRRPCRTEVMNKMRRSPGDSVNRTETASSRNRVEASPRADKRARVTAPSPGRAGRRRRYR